jgi:protein involved in polysaccharide export with SLBB domain
MRKTTVLAVLLVGIPWGINAQTYGRMNIESQISSQEETQALESFEEEFALERAIDPVTYILGPGDELGLNILTSENITWPLIVSPSGELLIPSVGVIHVGGKTLQQGINLVEQFIKDRAFPKAQVSMTIVNIRSFLLQVSGAVNSPGFVKVTPVMRLHKVVRKAGNFHQLAREFDITVRSISGEEYKVDYLQFILYGDLGHNPTFQEGDKLIIPFGDVEKEGVVIRGALSGRGYDIIAPSETLEHFLWRKARFLENADLESVTITRQKNGKEEHLRIQPERFSSIVLKPGDTIDILRERGVSVNGFVQIPGGFQFFPGFTAADYINLAGGNTTEGNPNRVLIRHLDGSSNRGQDVLVRRGDIIVVPRNLKSSIFGDSSLLQIGTALLTVYLTYLATL